MWLIKRKHEDWFADIDIKLFEMMKTSNKAQSEMMNWTTGSAAAKYKQAHKGRHHWCMELKNQWKKDTVAELQELADFNDTKDFYKIPQNSWTKEAKLVVRETWPAALMNWAL